MQAKRLIGFYNIILAVQEKKGGNVVDVVSLRNGLRCRYEPRGLLPGILL